jgi:hypothetical protein
VSAIAALPEWISVHVSTSFMAVPSHSPVGTDSPACRIGDQPEGNSRPSAGSGMILPPNRFPLASVTEGIRGPDLNVRGRMGHGEDLLRDRVPDRHSLVIVTLRRAMNRQMERIVRSATTVDVPGGSRELRACGPVVAEPLVVPAGANFDIRHGRDAGAVGQWTRLRGRLQLRMAVDGLTV